MVLDLSRLNQQKSKKVQIVSGPYFVQRIFYKKSKAISNLVDFHHLLLDSCLPRI